MLRRGMGGRGEEGGGARIASHFFLLSRAALIWIYCHLVVGERQGGFWYNHDVIINSGAEIQV